MIPTNLILWISIPFLGLQATLYQILFDKFFLKRFEVFNAAVKKYIRGDIATFIRELGRSNRNSNINHIIDSINKRASTLSQLNDLRKKRDSLTELAKYSYLLLAGLALLGLLAVGQIIQRPLLFDATIANAGSFDLLDGLFMISIIFLVYLGYKLLDLNYLITKYETEGSLSRIIDEINEENEE